MIVQQEFPHDAAPGHGLIKDGEETVFGFSKTAFQIRDQPAPIVEEAEDDHALVSSRCRIHQQGTMQRIGLPEFPAHRGLPAVPCGVVPLHARDRQAVPLQQPLHTRHAGLSRGNPSGQFQFPQDHMRRAPRVFPFHIQDQLL